MCLRKDYPSGVEEAPAENLFDHGLVCINVKMRETLLIVANSKVISFRTHRPSLEKEMDVLVASRKTIDPCEFLGLRRNHKLHLKLQQTDNYSKYIWMKELYLHQTCA